MVPTEQMKSMKQLSLAETGFLPKVGKQTRKAVFLAEMDTVVPWSRLEVLIEPFYPRKGNGRPPMPLSTMLRIHFMQQWFGYSDPAMEEALHDVPLLRQFAGLDGVVAVANADVGFAVIHIQVDHQEGVRRLDAEDLSSDDVEEPPAACGFCEIDDTVREQHRPIERVVMPGFSSDERNEVFPETGRQVFFKVHDLLHLALQGGRIPVGDVSPFGGLRSKKKLKPQPDQRGCGIERKERVGWLLMLFRR